MCGFISPWFSSGRLCELAAKPSCYCCLQVPGVTVWDAGALGGHGETKEKSALSHTCLCTANDSTLAIPVRAAGMSAVQLGSVEFHKLRNLLEDFGQRSALAQVNTTQGLSHDWCWCWAAPRTWLCFEWHP